MAEPDYAAEARDYIEQRGNDPDTEQPDNFSLGHLRALAADRDAREQDVAELREALSLMSVAFNFAILNDQISGGTENSAVANAASVLLARLDGRAAEGVK